MIELNKMLGIEAKLDALMNNLACWKEVTGLPILWEQWKINKKS